MRWFAEYQPFIPVIQTLRGLLLGTPIGSIGARTSGLGPVPPVPGAAGALPGSCQEYERSSAGDRPLTSVIGCSRTSMPMPSMIDLAVAVSAEALLTLTDLCGLTPEEAIASATRTARMLTTAAIAG